MKHLWYNREMQDYAFTRSRIFQWMGILLSLGIIAVGYWYYQSQASTTINKNLSDTLATGLAGYWAMDNGSGTSATDSSTNGNTGTLTAGPTWTTGQINGAVNFDGTDDYIDVGTAGLTAPARLTAAAWIRITDVAFGEHYTIFSNRSGGNGGWSFRASTSGTCNGVDCATLTFTIQGVADYATSASWVSEAQWTHVAFAWNGSAVTFYVNGVPVQTTSTGSMTTGSNLLMGALGPSPGLAGYFMDGRIDEARAYNRALSDEEISQLYRLTSPTGVDTSLKGYWTFDGEDTSGTTTYDRSGVGNTGTLTNGPTIMRGKIGQAISFDGNNDKVALADNAVFDVGGAGTWCNWFYSTANQSSKGMFSHNVSGGDYVMINGYLTTNSSILSGYVRVGTTAYTATTPTYATGYWNNQWHFVCTTFDRTLSSQRLKIYADGVLLGTHDAANGDVDAGNTPMVGNWVFGGGEQTSFQGSIDDVRMYNRALTVAEIKALYDKGQSDQFNTSSTQAQGALSLDSDLAGYWKLDDGTSGATPTTAADSSPVGNTGTLNGGPTWTTGRIGNAVNFDGSNDYISTAYSAKQTTTRTLTYAAWVAPGTNDSKGILGILNGDDSTTRNYCMIDNAGAEAGAPLVYCYLGIAGNATFVSSQFTSANDVWFHMALTYDGTALRLYINGVPLSVTAQTGAIDTVADDGLLIGRQNTAGSAYFVGKIDEVRMYTRALSQDEVTALYNLNSPTTDSGLRGYWSLNAQDMSGTTAYDRSGAGNTGTLTNTPVKSTGVVGQGINFDGSDDYVSIADDATLDIGDTEDLTLTGWFNRDTITTDDTIIAKRNGIANTDDGYILYIDDTTDKLTFEVSENSGTDEYQLESSTTFGPGWNHFAVVWDQDSASGSEIYVNGVANTATDTGTIGNLGDLANSVVLAIGAESDVGNPFDGKLDEVRVYKRALTAGEIKSLYDLSQSDKSNSSLSQPQGSGRLDSGLVNYWKFDENTGTSTTDSSTNAFTGTLTNGPTWTTGQVGSAINFDGTNDYVTATDSDDSKYLGDLTLCAWANIETAGNYRHFMGKHAGNGGTQNPFDFRTSTDNPPKMVLVRANSDNRSWMGPDTTLGQWKHYCVTSNAAIETPATFYINGVPTTGINSGNTATGAATGSGAAIRIGSRADATPIMDGSMDEVRIYNRVLSADEIAQIYRLGTEGNSTATETGLKGYWSFNGQDMAGTTAYDRSGAGNTATLTGPTKALGKIGQGISLDGSNDYASIPDANSIDYDYNQDFSFAIWVKIPSTQANTVAGDNFIIEKWSGSGGYSYALRIYNQTYGTSGDRGKIVFRRYDGTNNPGVTSTSLLNDNTWHHVAGVRNGAQLRLYVDGVLQATAVDTTSTTTTNTSPLYIGTRGGGSTNFFQGTVDEFRVYNRTLTDAEVLLIYNQSR